MSATAKIDDVEKRKSRQWSRRCCGSSLAKAVQGRHGDPRPWKSGPEAERIVGCCCQNLYDGLGTGWSSVNNPRVVRRWGEHGRELGLRKDVSRGYLRRIRGPDQARARHEGPC